MNDETYKVEALYYKTICELVLLLVSGVGVKESLWEESIFEINYKNGFIMEFIFSTPIVDVSLNETFSVSFDDGECYKLEEIPQGYWITNSLQDFLSDICYAFQNSKSQEDNLKKVVQYLKVDNDGEISKLILTLLSKQEEEMRIAFGEKAKCI